MPTQPLQTPNIEMIDDHPLDAHALARSCRQTLEWVQTRVAEGVLTPSSQGASTTTWRFSSTTIVRARRVAQLEQMYDADPQLAAMTVDLMEEVLMLRRQLKNS